MLNRGVIGRVAMLGGPMVFVSLASGQTLTALERETTIRRDSMVEWERSGGSPLLALGDNDLLQIESGLTTDLVESGSTTAVRAGIGSATASLDVVETVTLDATSLDVSSSVSLSASGQVFDDPDLLDSAFDAFAAHGVSYRFSLDAGGILDASGTLESNNGGRGGAVSAWRLLTGGGVVLFESTGGAFDLANFGLGAGAYEIRTITTAADSGSIPGSDAVLPSTASADWEASVRVPSGGSAAAMAAAMLGSVVRRRRGSPGRG